MPRVAGATGGGLALEQPGRHGSCRGGGRRVAAAAELARARPRAWRALVNEPQTAAELDALRTSIPRGRPFGVIQSDGMHDGLFAIP